MKCRTISYAGKERIDFVEVDVPDPKDGEVQVEALACGICAWDVHVFRNGPDWPTIPGHEGVGRIVKVGKGVTRYKEGDWVTAPCMGFTESQNFAEQQLYAIPEPHTRPEDWIVEPVSCVVTGHDHCAARAGDRIALVGCGYMGLMLVQVLGHTPLDTLIAIDVDAKRLSMAKRFGATQIINAKEVDADELKKLNIDTVVDASGSQAGLDLSSRIVRNGGRLNLFGWNHGTGTFPGDLWHMGGITVINSAPGSAIRDPWPVAIRLLSRGIIDQRPLITHAVSLDEYPALLAKAAAKEDGYIKGVVKLGTHASERTIPTPGGTMPTGDVKAA